MNTKMIFFLLILICVAFNSCFVTDNVFSDTTINKSLETKTNQVIITTTVDKYSSSKKWFYGTIKMKNLTKDTLLFNFNQTLWIDTLNLKADYNLYPVSYAHELFSIKPDSTRKWVVVWKTKTNLKTFNTISIKADTQIIKYNSNPIFIR